MEKEHFGCKLVLIRYNLKLIKGSILLNFILKYMIILYFSTCLKVTSLICIPTKIFAFLYRNVNLKVCILSSNHLSVFIRRVHRESGESARVGTQGAVCVLQRRGRRHSAQPAACRCPEIVSVRTSDRARAAAATAPLDHIHEQCRYDFTIFKAHEFTVRLSCHFCVFWTV